MKKLVSLFLAALMLFTCCSALAEIPANINQDGYVPIVNEKTTITVAFKDNAANTTTQEDKWFWQYADKFLNLHFETEGIQSAAAAERLNLLFAANDLPDVLWGFAFTPNQLVKYGTSDEQLMPLEDYITPELTPNLYALREELPEVFAAATAPDGHLYTIPNMTYIDTQFSQMMFMHQGWLEQVQKTSPTTLDEFIDVLYAFKEAKPGGEKTIPMGGNPTPWLLYALGYDGGGTDGTDPAVFEGQAVIPAAHERFIEYLKLMNQFYNDGIISQDYYTLTDMQTKAWQEEGIIGALNNVPSNGFSNWYAVQPLTSQWTDTPICPSPKYYGIGNFVMSAGCKNPEVVMRFVDYMYTDEGAILSSFGPTTEHSEEIRMGVGGYYIKDGALRYVDVDDTENSGYTGAWDYRAKKIFALTSDVVMDRRHIEAKYQAFAGAEAKGPTFDITQVDRYFRKANLEVIAPHYTPGFPNVIWMEEDDALRLADLQSILNNYMIREIASFVTGNRPLTEFEDYLKELDTLGMQEYLELYQNAYEQFASIL